MHNLEKMSRLLFVSLLALFVFSGCKKDGYDAEKQLAKEEQQIKEFIDANNIENAQRDESGIWYVLESEGSGNIQYTTNTKVTAKYTGRFLDGRVFDSSPSATFSVGGVITGWQFGILKLQKGGKMRLLIPSQYAYGPSDYRGIPGNSVLDFDLEILDVQN